MEQLYPLMLKLAGKRVVIVGGGKVALRKAQGLAVTGASVTVVSPVILPELLALLNIEWQQKRFEPNDIKNAHIIYAATDSREVNQSVAHSIQDWQWFDDTSSPVDSNFYTPAVIRSPDLTIAISTEGRDPAKAKRLKHQLMNMLTITDDTII